MSASPHKSPNREFERFAAYRNLSLVYEGRSERIEVHAPDISPKGMFIHIPSTFPEGAVMKLEFALSRTGRPIRTRAEVRYCLAGVGIGVEFIDITDDDRFAIETEIHELFGR